MNNPILNAAALLDDISSGTLSHGDFYLALDDAGQLAHDLVRIALRTKEESDEHKTISLAAECLKDICISTDTNKLMAALLTAKMHSQNLYLLNERSKSNR